MSNGMTTLELPSGVAFPIYNKKSDLGRADPMPGLVLLLRGVHVSTTNIHIPGSITNTDNLGIAKILRVGPPGMTPDEALVDLKLEPDMIVLFAQHEAQRHMFQLSECRRLMLCRQQYVLAELTSQETLAKAERTF